MRHLPQHSQTRTPRSPRVSVPDTEQAVVKIGLERAIGILRKLSATGGSLRLSKQFTPGTLADITIRTTCGNVGAAIELLGVADGARTQAFRFVQMESTDRARLMAVLEQMREQGFGEKQNWRSQPILQLAHRTLSTAKKIIRLS